MLQNWSVPFFEVSCRPWGAVLFVKWSPRSSTLTPCICRVSICTTWATLVFALLILLFACLRSISLYQPHSGGSSSSTSLDIHLSGGFLKRRKCLVRSRGVCLSQPSACSCQFSPTDCIWVPSTARVHIMQRPQSSSSIVNRVFF